MSPIYLVEPNKAGAEHVSFNAAMLHLLQQTLPGRIVLFCARSHREQLAAVTPAAAAVPWREVPVVSGLTRDFVRKFGTELAVVSRVMVRARRERAAVVFLSLFPNVLAVLLLLQRAFRDVPVHVFLHGELESLIIPEKRAIHREGFWTELALLRLFRGGWPRLHVLGDGIKARLLERFPGQPSLGEIGVLEHPYLFPETEDRRASPGETFRVGFVGAGRTVKGIESFFALAEALDEHVRAGKLEFVVVGGLEKTMAAPPNVTILADRAGGLAVADYFRAIESLDCAVFLYDRNYCFTASGSVLDVIAANVEILSLRNHYLADVARSDVEGGIKFFDNLGEIEAEIRRRVSGSIEGKRYRYPHIKRAHSAEAQACLARILQGTAAAPASPDRGGL